MLVRVFATAAAVILVACAGVFSEGATEEEYMACGCGCCDGEPADTRCVANRGELERIENEDEQDRDDPSCEERDCQPGIRYIVCD
jgi:hypothetical protein